MKKIIAITIENGGLCAHFEHCQYFAIVGVEAGIITEVKDVTPPEYVPGLYPRLEAQFSVIDVLGVGMVQKAIDLINQQNINAFVGAPLKSSPELLTDFLANKLNLLANYCNHDENHVCSHLAEDEDSSSKR